MIKIYVEYEKFFQLAFSCYFQMNYNKNRIVGCRLTQFLTWREICLQEKRLSLMHFIRMLEDAEITVNYISSEIVSDMVSKIAPDQNPKQRQFYLERKACKYSEILVDSTGKYMQEGDPGLYYYEFCIALARIALEITKEVEEVRRGTRRSSSRGAGPAALLHQRDARLRDVHSDERRVSGGARQQTGQPRVLLQEIREQTAGVRQRPGQGPRRQQPAHHRRDSQSRQDRRRCHQQGGHPDTRGRARNRPDQANRPEPARLPAGLATRPSAGQVESAAVCQAGGRRGRADPRRQGPEAKAQAQTGQKEQQRKADQVRR